MYAVGQLISGNSLARSAIFFYALLLHAVIFLILARWVVADWISGLSGTGVRVCCCSHACFQLLHEIICSCDAYLPTACLLAPPACLLLPAVALQDVSPSGGAPGKPGGVLHAAAALACGHSSGHGSRQSSGRSDSSSSRRPARWCRWRAGRYSWAGGIAGWRSIAAAAQTELEVVWRRAGLFSLYFYAICQMSGQPKQSAQLHSWCGCRRRSSVQDRTRPAVLDAAT